MDTAVPSVSELRATAQRIAPFITRTPTIEWPGAAAGATTDSLFVKLELMQRTGSFKPRGAVNTLLNQSIAADGSSLYDGVTAFSAGNHAIATAFAAARLGKSAKLVMPRSANPFRVEQCRAYDAELVFGDSISDLMGMVESIVREDERLLVHPFEGIDTAMGTAGVGLELCDDIKELDAVIVPVGGGGLIAGVATAVKQLQPQCQVIGVEPVGAAGMQQSLEAGQPVSGVVVDTIADSLGAPFHAPVSFALVSRFVDQIVSVSDEQLRAGMRQMFREIKLAVEPACAASLAALTGPLSDQLRGKRVALIACGSNIDWQSYCALAAP